MVLEGIFIQSLHYFQAIFLFLWTICTNDKLLPFLVVIYM
jgi:hypothetical protein